jgi:hypothetical protein
METKIKASQAGFEERMTCTLLSETGNWVPICGAEGRET